MLSYPVRLADTAEGKVRVTFFDIPEAVAEGSDRDDALYRAKFVLEQSLGNYVMHGREIPAASQVADAPTVGTDKFSLSAREEPVEAGETHAAPGGGRY